MKKFLVTFRWALVAALGVKEGGMEVYAKDELTAKELVIAIVNQGYQFFEITSVEEGRASHSGCIPPLDF